MLVYHLIDNWQNILKEPGGEEEGGKEDNCMAPAGVLTRGAWGPRASNGWGQAEGHTHERGRIRKQKVNITNKIMYFISFI